MWLRGFPVQLDLNALGTLSADSAEKHAHKSRPGPWNTPDLSSTRVDGITSGTSYSTHITPLMIQCVHTSVGWMYLQSRPDSQD